jgi:hypothetical protein
MLPELTRIGEFKSFPSKEYYLLCNWENKKRLKVTIQGNHNGCSDMVSLLFSKHFGVSCLRKVTRIKHKEKPVDSIC